ncbi:hypothetical protein BRADI_1g33019v3 [Brachypodium distachyon]|uniref:Uncharacterized protein n=1 Tax=Brachypodium distachyon TaxID=15368 RepID=A0A2K2DMH2_BRADI|nr:hypothetical protein BRADI_1g33019v3 [Brachypodium distachyon]
MWLTAARRSWPPAAACISPPLVASHRCDRAAPTRSSVARRQSIAA